MKAESVRYLAMLRIIAEKRREDAVLHGFDGEVEHYDCVLDMVDEIAMMEGVAADMRAELAQCQREIESLEGEE